MPKKPGRSESVDDFLKAVYTLQDSGSARVSTNDLSSELGIAASSVTAMAQRLVQNGLIDYQRYGGVLLTPEGEAQALHIIRRHRMIESYLMQELGYALHEVHEEAEALEHAVSERFMGAIERRLNDLAFDPHGDPIPAPDGSIIERHLVNLVDLPTDQRARVAQLKGEDSTLLQYIVDRGFALHTPVTVLGREPFEGPMTVDVDGETRSIGHPAASAIFVEVE